MAKDYACPLRDYMEAECKNLIGLVNRMKDRCWGDHWENAIGEEMDLNPHIPKVGHTILAFTTSMVFKTQKQAKKYLVIRISTPFCYEVAPVPGIFFLESVPAPAPRTYRYFFCFWNC